MSLKRWVWINGKALNQQEAAWPEITVMQFGTENPGCQQIINSTFVHSNVNRLSETINVIQPSVILFLFSY